MVDGRVADFNNIVGVCLCVCVCVCSVVSPRSTHVDTSRLKSDVSTAATVKNGYYYGWHFFPFKEKPFKSMCVLWLTRLAYWLATKPFNNRHTNALFATSTKRKFRCDAQSYLVHSFPPSRSLLDSFIHHFFCFFFSIFVNEHESAVSAVVVRDIKICFVVISSVCRRCRCRCWCYMLVCYAAEGSKRIFLLCDCPCHTILLPFQCVLRQSDR